MMKRSFCFLSWLFLLCGQFTYASSSLSDASRLLLEAAKNGNLQMSQIVLREGARLDAVDETGMTALAYAILNRDSSLVIFFLDFARAPISAPPLSDHRFVSPTQRSQEAPRKLGRKYSHTETQSLGTQNSDTDSQTNLRRSRTKRMKGRVDRLSMRLGGGMHQRSFSQVQADIPRNPLELTEGNSPAPDFSHQPMDHASAESLLFQGGVFGNYLHLAAQTGNLEILTRIYEAIPFELREFYINQMNPRKETALVLAIRESQDSRVVLWFIQRGANLNPTNTIHLPLACALKFKLKNIALLLVLHGANIEDFTGDPSYASLREVFYMREPSRILESALLDPNLGNISFPCLRTLRLLHKQGVSSSTEERSQNQSQSTVSPSTLSEGLQLLQSFQQRLPQTLPEENEQAGSSEEEELEDTNQEPAPEKNRTHSEDGKGKGKESIKVKVRHDVSAGIFF